MKPYDVAVVGAGPAGAWTAYSLARRGARVAIVDSSHPREKPCGGGVTGRALSLVASAVCAADLPAVVVHTARFVDAATGSSAVVPLDNVDGAGDGPGNGAALVVVSRADFDGRLLGAARGAGAELIAARVTDVAAESDAVCIQTTAGRLRTAFVVGADGANSLVRRRLARAFRRDQLSIATGYFAHGVTSDEIVIGLVGNPAGYLWSFPRPSHLAIGICAQADAGATPEALRSTVTNWMRSSRLGAGAPLQPYSWPIPSLSAPDFGALAVCGPRWCLVGDAAGLVDPITREGIYFALASAQWAADALAAPHGRGLEHYQWRVRDEILPELERAARVKALFFHPRTTRLLIDALRRSSRIRAVMADLVAGRQGYRALKWRLAATCEIALAWRWLRDRDE